MTTSTIAMRFVDTNILVYAEQPTAGDKHAAACELLRDVWSRRDGIVSAQVLQELYVTATRKLPCPYEPSVARRLVVNYSAWTVIAVDAALVLDAIEIQEQAKLSYWDAAIIAAAVIGGARELLTEDLNHGQVIRGVRITNPLLGS